MPCCIAYIGDLEGGHFQWDGGNWSGNSPPHISCSFPDSSNACYFLWDLIDKGHFKEAQQTDWGCSVAKVTKQEILDFLHLYYGDKVKHPEKFWSSEDRKCMESVLKAIAALEDGKLYGL